MPESPVCDVEFRIGLLIIGILDVVICSVPNCVNYIIAISNWPYQIMKFECTQEKSLYDSYP